MPRADTQWRSEKGLKSTNNNLLEAELEREGIEEGRRRRRRESVEKCS